MCYKLVYTVCNKGSILKGKLWETEQNMPQNGQPKRQNTGVLPNGSYSVTQTSSKVYLIFFALLGWATGHSQGWNEFYW